MRSLWLLHELGLDFDLVVHDFGPDLRSESYLAKHPLGRVPALEIDGAVLFETGAITEYLCETRAGGDLYRAPGTPERMAWLQWLHYAETVAVHAASLTQQHIVIYEDKDRSAVVIKLETRRLEKALEVLDTHLNGRDYLLSGFSAADISVGYSAYVAQFFVDLSRFENLSRWFETLSRRPAFQKALPPEGANIIYKSGRCEAPVVS